MAEPDDFPNPLQIAQAAAAQLGEHEWALEAEPIWEEEPEPESPPPEPEPESPKLGNIFPPENAPDPPSPLKIVEAMLFVGGAPLTAEDACSAIRGLDHERFRSLIEELARKYRLQNRPYSVVPEGEGYSLALKPKFRSMKEKLHGGPREVQLAQPALDILSLIAYRQPITKPELDAISGTDAAGPLRQLARLGLVSVQQRATSADAAGYGTTPKFLALFGLASLDDLPRLGEVAL
jgi:segregation and condensation protein B